MGLMFDSEYKERKRAEELARQLKKDEEYRIGYARYLRIQSLKEELGITSRYVDPQWYEELFIVLKSMRDRIDALEEKNKG